MQQLYTFYFDPKSSNTFNSICRFFPQICRNMIFWQKNVFSLVAKNDVVAFTRNLFMKKKKFLFLKIFVKPDFLGPMLGRKVDRNGGFSGK